MGRRPRALPLVLLLASTSSSFAAACNRGDALDSVTDLGADPSVWRADGEEILGALPQVVASFKPSEPGSGFSTTYRTGPVFGAARTYSDGPRQLVLRVESGNVRDRAAALMHGKANPGESFMSREALVHGQKASVHWNAVGKTADVVYVLRPRYVLSLHLVPAATDEEAVQLAEDMDVRPLQGLTLAGVK